MASQNNDMYIRKVTDKLQFDLNSELGRGVCSIVYKGQFEDIPVAVKAVKCKNAADARDTMNTFTNSRERKIMNMVERERHNNIIGYYVSEIQNNTMYIALELCNGNLTEYVRREDLMASYPPMKVNKDIALGVDFLHSKKIAHRDLKPENVYFLSKDDSYVTKIVIGDFGTSKWSVGDYYSLSESGKGTFGYIAHEVWLAIDQSNDDEINPRKKMSLKSDIFALGCVFYFSMSKGSHPFGSATKRQNNIHLRKPPAIDRIEQSQNPMKELIVKMLSHNPEERPTASELIDEPAFWSAEQIIRFLADISDVLKGADDFTKSQMENQDVTWGGNWDINMPVHLLNHLQNNPSPGGRHIYRNNCSSVCGLLRIIRNVASHYREFPAEAQRELGEYPAGHVDLWMRLCPLLLMHVYRKASELNLGGYGQQVHGIEPSRDTQMGHGNTSARALHIRPELRESVSSDSGISSHPSSSQMSSADNAELTSPKVLLTNDDKRQPPVSATGYGEQTNRMSDDRSPVGIDPPAHMNQLSINDTVTRFEFSGSSQTTLTDRSDRLDIVRQTYSMYAHDRSYWAQCAKDEIDDAKRCLQQEIRGRATILCLDISESMAEGEAWTQAKQFVEDVFNGLEGLSMLLAEKNFEHMSIITFGHETKVLQRLTNDSNELKASFNRIKLGGPSPMYGGFMQAAGTAAVVQQPTGKPTIALISDFKPTETTRYAGPDIQDGTAKDETSSAIIEVLTEFNEKVHIVFVPVGDVDQGFLDLLCDVTTGERLTYSQGRELIRKGLVAGTGIAATDMYGEAPNTSLPAIGSRVVRGPDWKYAAQDSNGPGTIIGQAEDSAVWVEWDADGHRNNYLYGHSGTYHVLLTDHRRAISEYGTLKVGNVVTRRNGQDKGVVIKVLGNGKVHVRWETGERGDYGFGNDLYEVWPWSPDATPTTTTRSPSSAAEASAAAGSDTKPASVGKQPFRNKNLQPGRGRRT